LGFRRLKVLHPHQLRVVRKGKKVKRIKGEGEKREGGKVDQSRPAASYFFTSSCIDQQLSGEGGEKKKGKKRGMERRGTCIPFGSTSEDSGWSPSQKKRKKKKRLGSIHFMKRKGGGGEGKKGKRGEGLDCCKEILFLFFRGKKAGRERGKKKKENGCSSVPFCLKKRQGEQGKRRGEGRSCGASVNLEHLITSILPVKKTKGGGGEKRKKKGGEGKRARGQQGPSTTPMCPLCEKEKKKRGESAQEEEEKEKKRKKGRRGGKEM